MKNSEQLSCVIYSAYNGENDTFCEAKVMFNVSKSGNSELSHEMQIIYLLYNIIDTCSGAFSS